MTGFDLHTGAEVPMSTVGTEVAAPRSRRLLAVLRNEVAEWRNRLTMDRSQS